MYEYRFYRNQFNTERFKAFNINYLESDLWVGVDPYSFREEMIPLAFSKVKNLRNRLDSYIEKEPEFKKSLLPFIPKAKAPKEAIAMINASSKAGIGPMSSVAGMFAQELGKTLLQNFSINELVIENGGDIYASLKKDLVLSIFAGNSALSGKIGAIIPANKKFHGICTSAGTVGPSLSLGNADAVVVICKDTIVADAFATALGNMVKTKKDIKKVIDISQNYPEIKSIIIICEGQVGIRGEIEIRLLTQ